MSKNVPKFDTTKQTRFRQPISPRNRHRRNHRSPNGDKDLAPKTAQTLAHRRQKMGTGATKPHHRTEMRTILSSKIPDTSHRLTSTVGSTQIQTNYMPSQYTKPEEGFCMKKSCVRLKDFGSTNTCRRHQNQFLISDTK